MPSRKQSNKKTTKRLFELERGGLLKKGSWPCASMGVVETSSCEDHELVQAYA